MDLPQFCLVDIYELGAALGSDNFLVIRSSYEGEKGFGLWIQACLQDPFSGTLFLFKQEIDRLDGSDDADSCWADLHHRVLSKVAKCESLCIKLEIKSLIPHFERLALAYPLDCTCLDLAARAKSGRITAVGVCVVYNNPLVEVAHHSKDA